MANTSDEDSALLHVDVEYTDYELDGLTLKQMAALACKEIDIGTAVLPKPLFEADVEDGRSSRRNVINEEENDENKNKSSTHYASVIEREFNAVVIEHHLKWAPLCVSEPGPLPDSIPSDRLGRYDFYEADRIIDWCIEHNIKKIKGHVLVWSVTTPKYLDELEPAIFKEQLKRHIFTVMGHYRGIIKYWDVVNEALAPDGSLAENIFYRKLGPSYIEDCFRWAHEADPDAILIYNDNKVEGVGTTKSDGFYELLADLKAKGVPVHGAGMQAHFNAAGTGRNRTPCPAAVKQQIRRVGSLGLKVNISEMDVRVSKLIEPALRPVAQRQIYYDILTAALTEPAFDGIWLWGFTDRHTWVHSFYYDDEPCIFDENYRRKEAYYGVRDAIATLTPGQRVGGDDVLLDADIDEDGNKWGYEWMIPDNDNVTETNNMIAGDARPDWEQDIDSGIEADTEGETTADEQIPDTDDDDEKPDLLLT